MTNQNDHDKIILLESKVDTNEKWNRQQDIRLEKLEIINTDKDKKIIKGGWQVIKLGGIFIGLTFLHDMLKKGCTGCQVFLDYLLGNR